MMGDNSGNSKHTQFLQIALRENIDKFADVRICCSDGCVKQNRIFLGIVETYLQKLPEYCSPEVETLVMLPEVSLQEYFNILNANLFHRLEQAQHQDASESCFDNLLKDLSKEVFYTGSYQDIPKMEFPDNIENLEIIMHDVLVGSDGTDDTSESHAPYSDISNVPGDNKVLSKHPREPVKKYSCLHCDKKFVREKAFLAHKSNYHNENVQVEAGKKPLLSCNICPLKFEAPVQLEKHIRSHTKSKPFQCEVCNKGFVSKSNLSAHLRLHEGTALRYSCSQCDKKFSHPSEVKQHMVVHTGVRAYTCHQCGNKYSRYPSLWKHLKKCNFTHKVILVKPLKQESVEVAGESVVVDEIVVTDGLGNDVMLADDSFSIETAL